ncbi:MAG: hypothetical protein ACI8RZ_001100 [Myxococcota bacterium]|jgi:hypothetical protein
MLSPPRFLQVASRYQVQLGWLRVIAQAVGDGRMGIEALSEVLLSHREQFNGWWEQTGLEGPARGIAQPATANRAARIGVTYGIHDPDSGRLTALGQVLRHAAPWQPGESPLVWRGGARWLGLWMTMSAAGDVLLSVLRTWPETGLDADNAPGFLAGVLRGLAQRADAESSRQLLDQAGRSAGKLRFARNFLIYPYLEPLRDLGYLHIEGRAGGYGLTPDGLRLQQVLSDDRDATDWLEDGLHGAYLTACAAPVGSLRPSTLAQILTALPTSLGSAEGADVQPILLLAQASLAEPDADAAVLELSEGRALLAGAADRSGGRLTVIEDRLQWQSLRPDLWSTPQPHPPTPAPELTAVTSTAVTSTAVTPTTVASSSTRAWLQAAAALLQAPTPGGPLCWGGPRAALGALRSQLEAGLPRSGAPLAALVDALCHAVEGRALLERVVERWDSDLSDDALLATLRRAQLAADSDRLARVTRLKSDLTASDAVAQTAALLGDAIAVDGWHSAELLDRLCRRIGALGEDAGATAFLNDLAAPPTPHTYVRILDIPLPAGRLDGVEITDGPGGQRQAWVSVAAPCPAAALRLARTRVDAVLMVCCYAARLPTPTGQPSETLSPPPPAPVPVPDGLLLPAPPRPLLALSSLGGPLLPLVTAVARGLPVPPIPALPEATAIAGIRAAIVAGVFAAEVALHRAALASPEPAVLAAIADWRGEDAAAAYRELSTLAPLLRPLKLPPPSPRSPAVAIGLLARVDRIRPVIAADWPWLVASLHRWSDALSDPTIWATEGAARRDRARELLTGAPLPILTALLDPVLEEAARSSGDELALHWAGVADRFDDLITLTGPISPTRLVEILG